MTVQMDVAALSEPYQEDLRVADEMVLIGAHADGVAGTTVLVAEHAGSGRGALQHYLRRIGYNVGDVTGEGPVLDSVFAYPADLVVLDLDENAGAADMLSEIRDGSSVPVIVCASQATERERVNLLNLGADDLLTKPFSFAELEARMRAVLRRGNATTSTKLEYGDLVIDEGTRTVTVESVDVPMTRKEFDLLAFLAGAPGRVFSRDDLLERVWGSNGRWQGRSTVTEHIRRVRLKIEEDPENPRWITTIRGVGYRFTTPMGAM